MKCDSQKRLNKDSFRVAGNRKGGNFETTFEPSDRLCVESGSRFRYNKMVLDTLVAERGTRFERLASTSVESDSRFRYN